MKDSLENITMISKEVKKLRYAVLELRNKKVKIKNKDKILNGIKDFLDCKTFGVLLVSEINKKNQDVVKTFAVNCDEEHSRKIIKYMVDNLPGLKEEILNDYQKNTINTMVN
ncbi:MAG: hypothetical protein PHQ98_03425 [Candidatus ainarchaeum sp.]|nr:hypothetical protein [Candidatus ainarchaeum sp.]